MSTTHTPIATVGGGPSVLDLFETGFTLLAAETGPSANPGYSVHILPRNSEFALIYQLEPGGCVLARPDGYVCRALAAVADSG